MILHHTPYTIHHTPYTSEHSAQGSGFRRSRMGQPHLYLRARRALCFLHSGHVWPWRTRISLPALADHSATRTLFPPQRNRLCKIMGIGTQPLPNPHRHPSPPPRKALKKSPFFIKFAKYIKYICTLHFFCVPLCAVYVCAPHPRTYAHINQEKKMATEKTYEEKSSFERSMDDISRGRIEKFDSADEMCRTLGI